MNKKDINTLILVGLLIVLVWLLSCIFKDNTDEGFNIGDNKTKITIFILIFEFKYCASHISKEMKESNCNLDVSEKLPIEPKKTAFSVMLIFLYLLVIFQKYF